MIIAPSVLSLDYSKFETQVAILNNEVEWLHFDVMDGHFVPNLTFGPDILKAFKKASSLFMDVHMMVSDPAFFLETFYKAGANAYTFHYEAIENKDDILPLIREIKKLGLKAGMSIKPKTNVEILLPYLNELDIVLVMSVEPGFGGQSFIESSYDKIEYLNNLKNQYNYLVEVDGGVNDTNAPKLKEAGVDVLVAGSFVFKGDIVSNIQLLK